MTTAGCTIVYDKFPEITMELQPKVQRVIVMTCLRVVERAKLSMAGPKSGRLYRRGRIGRKMSAGYAGLKSYKTKKGSLMAIVGYKTHRASAPGQAPAMDTGALVNSLSITMVGPTSGMIFSNLRYAAALEFGSSKRGLLPRPFLTPALEAERENHLLAMRQVFYP